MKVMIKKISKVINFPLEVALKVVEIQKNHNITTFTGTVIYCVEKVYKLEIKR